MPNELMYDLDPELLELVAQFIFRSIKADLFAVPDDRPTPENEIREALQRGGGYIKLREDSNCFLIVTHRNGRLLVHKAHTRAVIHNATTVTGLSDDSATIDQRRRLIGLSETGLLVELGEESNGVSLDSVCHYRWQDEVSVPDNAPRVKVTLLDIQRINVSNFIEGFTESRASAPAV